MWICREMPYIETAVSWGVLRMLSAVFQLTQFLVVDLSIELDNKQQRAKQLQIMNPG